MSLDPTPGLTLFNGLDAMVASYERSRDLLKQGFESIAAARAEFDAHFALGGGMMSKLRVRASKYYHHDIDGDDTAAQDELLRSSWTVIVERLELKRVMSVERWAELQKQLKDGELPAITHDNVKRFGLTHINPRSLQEMMNEAIAEVFSWLRPRQWSKYKRNSAFEIPERIALSGVVESNWGDKFRVRYGSGGKSDDRVMMLALENVFSWLDGKGQVAESHKSHLEQAIEACKYGEGHGETELFEFRAYKNRSLHLRFKRLDLLKRLNEIAGGLNLRSDEDGEADLARAS